MKSKQFYPVIMTTRVAATAAFYVDHFRFQPLFDSGWYVHLQSKEDLIIKKVQPPATRVAGAASCSTRPESVA